MKKKTITIIVGIVIMLGSLGCSSTRYGVWYLGDKAYAKNPTTGKIESWESSPSDVIDKPSSEIGIGGAFICLFDCIIN